jgi:hypothetical protein
MRPEVAHRGQHARVDPVYHRAGLQAPLELPPEPGAALPGLYGIDAPHLVAEAPQRVHAHQAGLAGPDLAEKENFGGHVVSYS